MPKVWKWASICFLVIAALGAAALAFWPVVRVVTIDHDPLPPAFAASEAALAGPGAFGLFHFDVGYAVKVEREMLGEEDRQALLRPLAAAETLGAIWEQSGIDLRAALDHILVGLVERDGGAGLAGVLLGRFPVEQIRNFLPEAYEVETGEVAGQPVFLLTRTNPDTCEVTGPLVMHLTPERVTMADPETLGWLLPRLQESAAAGIDLADWRAYRAERLFSMMLQAPEGDVTEGVTNPFGRMAAEATQEGLAPVERFYAGLAVAPPAGFRLDSRFHSTTADWPRQVAADLEAWRADLSETAAKDLPSLVRLQEHLELSADDRILTARLALDRTLLQDFAQVPVDILRLLFLGLGANPGTETSVEQPEQTVAAEELPQYLAAIGHEALGTFDEGLDPGFQPQAASGPFGVKIQEIRLKEDPAGPLLEIVVTAQSSAIANMEVDGMHGGEDRPPAQLVVSRVLDGAGQDLLRAEPCGRERNALPLALATQTRSRFVDNEFQQVPIVTGQKAVRLKLGTRLADVAAIEGRLSLRLPTRTEVVRVSAPFAGQVIEDKQVRLRFGDDQPSSLSYDLSGDSGRILAVRALNGDGAYLAAAGAQSAGRLFEQSRNVTRDFRGRPAAAEVVVAREVEAQDYAFRLSPVWPRTEAWDFPKPYRVETASIAGLESAFPAIAADGLCDKAETQQPHPAFAVCAQGFEVGWGGYLRGEVVAAAPKSAALEGNLSGLELVIDRLTVEEDAGPQVLDLQIAQFLRLDVVSDKDYLSSNFNRYVTHEGDEALEGKTLRGLEGRLVVRLPGALTALRLDVSQPGNRAEAENGPAAQLLAITEGGLSLSLEGARDRLVQFVPHDEAGTALATNAVRVEAAEQGAGWVARMQISGRPASLDIVYAEKQELLELPVTLTWQP